MEGECLTVHAVPGLRLHILGGKSIFVERVIEGYESPFAVLAESKQADDPAEAERIRAEIAHKVSQTVGYNARAVLVLPPGSVPKTGSGKLQRGKAAELFARIEGQAADYTSRRGARA